MLYVRQDIPSDLIASKDKPIENIFIELNLQNTKMLINCSYNHHKAEIKKHLTELTRFKPMSDFHLFAFFETLV